ncbi:antirestriction protein ArdA, partial [uncultured Oscillibacter sp.]|uniref:antirestriction protein ArdA n=1 Tax=uncultured Oscillibacter sp. TaxID=876091 RepID=UPI003452BA22
MEENKTQLSIDEGQPSLPDTGIQEQIKLAAFEAVMDSGEYTGSVKDLINLAQNLDNYNFYSDIHTEEELGRMYIQELEAVPVPEHLIDYID